MTKDRNDLFCFNDYDSKEQKEYEDLNRQWAAYDLFMRCMHPNGIAYEVIKQKLPLINEEVA